MTTDFDIIIIGAGPGGYLAADRLGAAGQRVLLIEKEHPGGTCLNTGCIPSKVLLHAAKLFSSIQQAGQFGIQVDSPRLDWATVIERKRRIVATLRDGVAYQMNRRNVLVIYGAARFIRPNAIQVDETVYTAARIIIATGSAPAAFHLATEGAYPHVFTTAQMLDHPTLPQRLVILGAGPLAWVLGSIYAHVGVEVTLLDAAHELLPALDSEIVWLLKNSLPFIETILNASITAITSDSVQYIQDGKTASVSADAVLLCTDRQPNVAGLGLEAIGVDFDTTGIRVNSAMQTNIAGIYAIGDVTGRAMWAHAAARMADVAVNHILGRRDMMRYEAIPTVVYSYPEIASVGLTEASARAQGLDIKTARLPMSANGRFVTDYEGQRGLCKVVVDARTNVLLGVHMLGANSTELIYGAAAMIEDEFRVEDAWQIVFPHPTIAEILKDTLFEIPV